MNPPPDSGSPHFPPTRLSLVEALGSTDPVQRTPAYDALIRVYWKPVCRYLEVARRFAREDAEDLTQGFFARAFDRATLDSYDPSKARFRTFLRVCVDRFAANAIERDGRLKRDGGMVSSPLDSAAAGPAVDPEQTQDIGAYLEGAPVSAHRENPLERAARFAGRHRTAIGLIAAYLVIRLLLLALDGRPG